MTHNSSRMDSLRERTPLRRSQPCMPVAPIQRSRAKCHCPFSRGFCEFCCSAKGYCPAQFCFFLSLPKGSVIVRLDRTIQYAAASRIILASLGNRFCGHTFAFPRRDAPEVCKENSLPSAKRGRRESRMRAAPGVSCAKLCKNTHTSIQVQRRQSDFPCAMVLTVYSALSPVIGLV